MMPRFLIAAALAATTMSAYAAPDKTPLVYDSTVNDTVPAATAGACPINIVSITDNRFSKEGMGADTPIVTDSPEPWLSTGLDTLKAYGYTVQHSSTPVPNALNLDVKLIRSYSWYGHMRINGMVAVDVLVGSPDGAKLRKFRAAGSKTNMMGATSEHITALNYALNHMVNQMAAGLASECAARKLAAR